MSINLDEYTVAEWYVDKEKHRCGYCKDPHGSVSYGMWVETMTVEDYQDLINRGWRRSGNYCYKPQMNETCCPQYTIRCHAPNFRLTKSQKKVIKKLNKYLVDGNLCLQNSTTDTPNDDGVNDIFIKDRHNLIDKNVLQSNIEIDKQCDITSDSLNKPVQQVTSQINDGAVISSSQVQCNGKTKKGTFKEGMGIDPNKPPCKKAKQLRLERKKEKLLKRGMSLEKLNVENEQKSLEQLIDDIPETAKHKLRLKLIPTSRPGREWENNKQLELQLYSKYQTKVHNDPPEKVTMRSFERFLVSSPLQIELRRMNAKSPSFNVSAALFQKYQMRIHNEPSKECDSNQFKSFLVDSPIKPSKFPNGVEGCGYGSFHQQYWIDDTLIAVGVIDILPKCVSSVYFFYDPDYRNLTLGTYGSLRELYFTRSLNALVPSLDHYYMGFYIHSCPKMLYKGRLVPSYLLCPETYKWFPIEKCVPKLAIAKYSRLNEDSKDTDENICQQKDIDSIKILLYESHQLTNFRVYKTRYGEEEVFRNIGNLIGKNMCERVILVK